MRRRDSSSAGSRGTRAGERGSVPGSADEAGAAAELGYRPLLFSIAYGMTGSVCDAEDIVQDAFVGLTRARQAGTVTVGPKAHLTTTVMALGLNPPPPAPAPPA